MAQRPGIIMNTKADKLWLGPRDDKGYLWALQQGVIFSWSDSNTCYESAWWLNRDGTPAKGTTQVEQQRIDAICKERPFDPIWIKEALDGEDIA